MGWAAVVKEGGFARAAAWPLPSAVFGRFDVSLAKRENGDGLQGAASKRNVAL